MARPRGTLCTTPSRLTSAPNGLLTEALCLKGCCEQTCAHKFKTFGSGEKIWGSTNFYVNRHAFEVPAERLDGAQRSAAALHNGVGYLLGYWMARVAKLDQKSCRTVSFKVGMQNGGMGSGPAAASDSARAGVK